VPAIAVDRASWLISIGDNTIANVYAGIDIAGSKNLVSGNVIHGTKAWAVRIDGGSYNQLEHLETYDLGAQTANGIVLMNGGNHQVAPPRLTAVTITPERTTSAGTLPADGTVQFFYSDSCGTPAGRFLVGEYGVLAGPFTVDTPFSRLDHS
jgi:hypothetical protein